MDTALTRAINKMLSMPAVVDGSYGIAAVTLKAYLPEDRALACAENLTKIGVTESQETIEVLRLSGELSTTDEELCQSLKRNEISPNQLTLAEAKEIYAYIADSDEKIINTKVNKIVDILTGIMHGSKESYRDYRFDPEKSEILETLRNKGVQYDKGEYDASLGFDIERYPNDIYDMPLYKLKHHTQIFTLDELVDEGYIDEDDIYIYGPYTGRDLREMEYFVSGTWTTLTDRRTMPRLERLIEEKIYSFDMDIKSDMNREYISNLVLAARRPDARNMVAILGAFGRQCNQFISTLSKNSAKELNLAALRKHLGWSSYYASRVCHISEDTLLQKYGVHRPISSEYFEDIIKISGAWTSEEESLVEKDFGSMLLKLDDHMFNAQAEYANIVVEASKNKKSGNKGTQQTLLPQFATV